MATEIVVNLTTNMVEEELSKLSFANDLYKMGDHSALRNAIINFKRWFFHLTRQNQKDVRDYIKLTGFKI